MTDYRKLDELMTNLEESSDRLVELTIIAERVADLGRHQDDMVQGFRDSISRVNTSVNDLSALTQTLQNTLAEQLSGIQQENERTAARLTQRVADEQKALQQQLTEQTKHQQARLDGLQRDNRQFYGDLEKLLRIKLDENKAEIKRLIEHERAQINDRLDAQTLKLLKKQQVTQTTSWLVGGLLALLNIAILVKLFIL